MIGNNVNHPSYSHVEHWGLVFHKKLPATWSIQRPHDTWRCAFCRTIATCKVPKFVFYLFHRDMTRYVVSPDVIEMGWKYSSHNWLTTAERKQQLQESSRKNKRNDTTNFHQLHLNCLVFATCPSWWEFLDCFSLCSCAVVWMKWPAHCSWEGKPRTYDICVWVVFNLVHDDHVCIKKEIWSMLYRVCMLR